LVLAAMPERRAKAIVPSPSFVDRGGRRMKTLVMIGEDVTDVHEEELLVHVWRAEQLQHLGLHRILAEAFADVVDWHVLADLIARGCAPELALEIVR
jgi:hypothetical protein